MASASACARLAAADDDASRSPSPWDADGTATTTRWGGGIRIPVDASRRHERAHAWSESVDCRYQAAPRRGSGRVPRHDILSRGVCI